MYRGREPWIPATAIIRAGLQAGLQALATPQPGRSAHLNQSYVAVAKLLREDLVILLPYCSGCLIQVLEVHKGLQVRGQRVRRLNNCYAANATRWILVPPILTSPVGLLSERTTSCTPFGLRRYASKNWMMSSWVASKGRLLILTTLSGWPWPPRPCSSNEHERQLRGI